MRQVRRFFYARGEHSGERRVYLAASVAQTPLSGLRLLGGGARNGPLYAGARSRLRRLVVSNRFFFVTVRLRKDRRPLDELQFSALARCLGAVRSPQGFLLTAGVFLPDHWHAILFPPYPFTIFEAMKSIKLSSHNHLGPWRRETGEL